jgi:hypothetical protein
MLPSTIAGASHLPEVEQCWEDGPPLRSFLLGRGDTLWGFEQTDLMAPADTVAATSAAIEELERALGPSERCTERMWLWRGTAALHGAVIVRPATDAPLPGQPIRMAVMRYLRLGPAPKGVACTPPPG